MEIRRRIVMAKSAATALVTIWKDRSIKIETKLRENGRIRYFGHITRSQGLKKILMTGTLYRKRLRGKLKNRYADNIKEMKSLNFTTAV